MRVALLVLLLTLSGCVGTAYRACPPLRQYSAAEQNQVANEIEAHGADVPGMVGFINDYGNVREAIRICRE